MGARISMIASGILALMATSAHAADVIVPEAPVAPAVPIATPFNWGGAYVGGQVGYGWGSSKFSARSEEEKAALNGISSNGFLGGIYAGYNFDTGTNLILGVDGDFTGSAIKRAGSTGGDEPTGFKTQLQWSGAARARVGYALDRFMPYIAGGAAFGNIKDGAHFQGEKVVSQSKIQTGWTIGGGADYAVTDNVIMRLEYRYTDFGKRNFNVGDTSVNASGKLSTNDVRLGIAYKF